MARRKQDVDIGINAKDNASRTVGRVESSFKKLGKALTVGLVAAAAAAAAAVGGLIKVFKSGVAAADEQEAAIKRLDAALRASGDFTEEASKDFQDFAASLQKITTTGDEVTLALLAMAKAFGPTNEQAKDLVTTALDVSEALGVNAETAVRALGQALQGNASQLARYVPEVRELTEEQLKAGEATKLLGERFDGMAESAAETSKGIREQLGNAIGDLNEKVGEALTKNDGFNQTMRDLRDIASDPATAQGLADTAAAIFEIGKASVKIAKEATTGLRAYYGVLFDGVASFAKWVNGSNEAQAAQEQLTATVDKAAEAQKALNDEKDRTARIDAEWAEQLDDVNALAKDLGVTLENEVNKELESYNEKLLRAQAAERDGIITREELIRLEEAFAEKKRELNEQLVDEADATNDATEALDSYTESALRATEQVTDLQQATEAATESAREASAQFGENLLGGRSEFSQLSGGTFSVPQPQVRTNRFGRVG